jgi:hypothetical protein
MFGVISVIRSCIQRHIGPSMNEYHKWNLRFLFYWLVHDPIYRSEKTIFAKKLEMVLITYMMNSKTYQSSHNYHWEGQEVGSLPTQTTYAFQVILRRTPTKIITHASRKHLKFPTMYSQHQPEDGMWSLISVFMIPTKTRANILVILKHRNLPRKISVIFLKHNWYIFLKRILVKLLVCMWLFTMVTIH